jgi:hypothetical protein
MRFSSSESGTMQLFERALDAPFFDSLMVWIKRVVRSGDRMVSTDYFRQGLLAQMGRASHGGLIDVLINSGELYRSLGGYPGSSTGMPLCCDAMQAEMKTGDILILDRSSGVGMTVRYLLPRAN